jgi:hypothetical protein
MRQGATAELEKGMIRRKSPQESLRKKARKGFHGYPVATIAFYGPDNVRASKVVLGVFLQEGGEPAVLERLFQKEDDVPQDPAIGQQMLDLLRQHSVRSVVITDGIIGCPHEEGIDYPEGKSCPQCPYWAGRDRFTGERVH